MDVAPPAEMQESSIGNESDPILPVESIVPLYMEDYRLNQSG